MEGLPSSTTLSNLFSLVVHHLISEKTILLYLFYHLHSGMPLNLKTVSRGTGMNLKTVSKHTEILRILGAIRRTRDITKQGRPILVHANPVKRGFDTIPPGLVSSITSILDISSQIESYRRYLGIKNTSTNIREQTLGSGIKHFGVAAIKEDADWKKAEIILLKYFRREEIMVEALPKARRFDKLCELILDETFDFEDYCRWYKENKYRGKGFNWGLFLYPTMIAEYRSWAEESGLYLKTASRLAASKSHQEGLERTDRFLDSLMEKKDAKKRITRRDAKTKGKYSRLMSNVPGKRLSRSR